MDQNGRALLKSKHIWVRGPNRASSARCRDETDEFVWLDLLRKCGQRRKIHFRVMHCVWPTARGPVSRMLQASSETHQKGLSHRICITVRQLLLV